MNNQELLTILSKKLTNQEIIYHFNGNSIFLIDKDNPNHKLKLDEFSIEPKGYEIISQKEENNNE
ncbi:MAG: hypothetical protein GBAus27B_000287 [Mycoplasmataceae bacterium]|nr:MAG: hypothetical protein GBAus27B_000287 [Mycoplasmataceae bacterium]